MIHSLAGGKMRDLEFADFVKVEIIEGDLVGAIRWFIFEILDLQLGDIVLVPIGLQNTPTKAKIIKIERNLSAQVSPTSIKHTKHIIKKVA